LGGTDGSTSKVEVVAKREVAVDPQKTEELPPGAESGGQLPFRAEGLRSMFLSCGSCGREVSCLSDPLNAASVFTLPRGNVFYAASVTQVRKFGLKKICPMGPAPGHVLDPLVCEARACSLCSFIVVPSPLPVAALVVRRRCLAAEPRR
jgi:hypothetical protein